MANRGTVLKIAAVGTAAALAVGVALNELFKGGSPDQAHQTQEGIKQVITDAGLKFTEGAGNLTDENGNVSNPDHYHGVRHLVGQDAARAAKALNATNFTMADRLGLSQLMNQTGNFTNVTGPYNRTGIEVVMGGGRDMLQRKGFNVSGEAQGIFQVWLYNMDDPTQKQLRGQAEFAGPSGLSEYIAVVNGMYPGRLGRFLAPGREAVMREFYGNGNIFALAPDTAPGLALNAVADLQNAGGRPVPKRERRIPYLRRGVDTQYAGTRRNT